MSGTITISSGGAVAVDPDAVRAAADRLEATVALVRETLDDLDRARRQLAVTAAVVRGLLVRAGDELELLAQEGRRLVEALRACAAAYELVELQVQRAAARAQGDAATIAALDAGIARLRREHPEAAGVAADALARRDAAAAQVPLRLLALGVLSPALWPALGLAAGTISGVAGTGLGRTSPGWTAPASAASVQRVGAVGTAAPPPTLADALARIPSGGAARVRVERYDLPGGGRSFAVYVTGTRALAARAEPWNMSSNVRLFTGGDAPSLAAVRAALSAAGAEPGDGLYAFGHSQGGMIVDALAAEGVYATEVLATAGSPTSLDAGAATFSAELRHPDDPVAALADGGHAQPVGSAGSFVAERTVEPRPGPHDASLAAHHLDEYVTTAALVDRSGDPRAAALHAELAALQSAERVRVYEFAPVVPVPQPVPSPQPSPVSGPVGGAG